MLEMSVLPTKRKYFFNTLFFVLITQNCKYLSTIKISRDTVVSRDGFIIYIYIYIYIYTHMYM